MKVLIISHNPVSTYQSMGKTILSLFLSFKKEELCQLFIYPTSPDVDKCNSYIRISDIDALKGVLKLRVIPVKVGVERNNNAESLSSIYGNGKNRNHSRELLRDVIWKLSPWFNDALKRWLAEENPTHIFVAPGRGKFLYDIAIDISNYLSIPIVTYICDDYYNLKKETGILGRIWQNTLRKKMKQLIMKSQYVVAICDEIASLYRNEFQCCTQTIMTGSNRSIIGKYQPTQSITSITYMGNISLNRYLSLIDIAKSLETISEYGTVCYLDIFTGTPSEEIQEALKKCKLLRLHGFVTGDEYEKEFNNSKAFLHVEAFDEKSIDRVKGSISTKIPDILASGKPVLAYGPDNIASIGHLQRNQCAFVATNKSELECEIVKLLSDPEERKTKVENALLTAKTYHDEFESSMKLRALFERG